MTINAINNMNYYSSPKKEMSVTFDDQDLTFEQKKAYFERLDQFTDNLDLESNSKGSSNFPLDGKFKGNQYYYMKFDFNDISKDDISISGTYEMGFEREKQYFDGSFNNDFDFIIDGHKGHIHQLYNNSYATKSIGKSYNINDLAQDTDKFEVDIEKFMSESSHYYDIEA